MFISRSAQSKLTRQQGSESVSLAELRRRLSSPSNLQDGHRQRLLDLARRLARVQAQGDEYARLELSEFVTSAMDRNAVAV